MQDPLVEEIPPHKLLLRNIPSDKLKKAVLKANTFNRKYWLEVAHVWMCAYLKNKPGEETRIPELDKEELRLSDTVLNALDKNNEAWQRIALTLGWNTWDLGIDPPGRKKKKQTSGIKLY